MKKVRANYWLSRRMLREEYDQKEMATTSLVIQGMQLTAECPSIMLISFILGG